MKINSIDFILSHFKSSTGLFPRKMITYSSKGPISIKSKEEILQRCREANFKECLLNAYPEILENNGTLIQSPNFILIDLDLSLCKTCLYPIRKLNYLLKQTLIQIKKEIYGQPTVLWTGNGYHIYLPVQVPILDTEFEYLKGRYQDLFSANRRYHDYYLSEVFIQFAEGYLTGGRSDPSHQHRYSNSMVRIPDTYNIDILSKGTSPEESLVKILQEWDGKIIDINPLLLKFQMWLRQQ
ncbi:MAG TPA: hypothetical protein VJU13_00590 [Candidatus Nitrosocosmicus sp.]|jgi:hypothetical protein|nr:hypothetical protein [Candidatus Nitrosocosmicus sp.]